MSVETQGTWNTEGKRIKKQTFCNTDTQWILLQCNKMQERMHVILAKGALCVAVHFLAH